MKHQFTYNSKLKFSMPIRKVVNRLNHKWAKENLERGSPQVVIYAFDHIGLQINNYGVYEEEILEAIMYFLSKQYNINSFETILDIGANIGNHSLYFSKKAKNVYAFEPNPNTFELLKFNTRNNKNISIFNLGLYNKNCKKILIENSLNIGQSFLNDTLGFKKDNHTNYKVNLSRLDSIKELFKKNISLIKIDVEGSEWEVMSGGKDLIEKNLPLILFEQDKDLKQERKNKLEDFFTSHNYKIYSLRRKFDFNIHPILKIFEFILRVIFGEKLIISEINKLPETGVTSFPLLIAVPKIIKN